MTDYRLDATGSELTVWTYKAGLLARAAHDLAIAATRFEAALEEGDDGGVRVDLRIPVADLRVRGKVRKGTITPMSAADHADIEQRFGSRDVLDGETFADVRFVGEGRRAGDAAKVTGELTLRGVTRPLTVETRLRGDGEARVAEGEVTLAQSEWGIQPYTALLGALKVQDRVRISWRLRYITGPGGAA